MKNCRKCNIDKEEADFYKGNRICKKCKIEYQKTIVDREKRIRYVKEYRIKNIESIKEKDREYYANNSESIKLRMKDNYSINRDSKIEYQKNYAKENADKISLYKKEHSKKNKDKIAEYKSNYQKNRRKTDTLFRLKHITGRIVRNAVKSKGFKKSLKTSQILGCSAIEFKSYIENKFTPEMTWENYGKVWDIDHIVPLVSAKTVEDVYKLNHYTNLQPLDSYFNRHVKRGFINFI